MIEEWTIYTSGLDGEPGTEIVEEVDIEELLSTLLKRYGEPNFDECGCCPKDYSLPKIPYWLGWKEIQRIRSILI